MFFSLVKEKAEELELSLTYDLIRRIDAFVEGFRESYAMTRECEEQERFIMDEVGEIVEQLIMHFYDEDYDGGMIDWARFQF